MIGISLSHSVKSFSNAKKYVIISKYYMGNIHCYQTITITIILACITSILSITFYYNLTQTREVILTEIKLTGYFTHLILLKMLQIMLYKDKISQIYHLVYLQLNKEIPYLFYLRMT